MALPHRSAAVSRFALNKGRVLVCAEMLVQALRVKRPNREDTDHAAAILEILLLQRAELARLLHAFLAIDDWTDESIAPASTVRGAQTMLDTIKDVSGHGYDLVRHLHRQREFSFRTFGPGPRTRGVLDHIRKELVEIEAAPGDLDEWVDVILLALDGAWRAGYIPEDIAEAIEDKQERNEARDWPDWRTQSPDEAIEHVRTTEERPA